MAFSIPSDRARMTSALKKPFLLFCIKSDPGIICNIFQMLRLFSVRNFTEVNATPGVVFSCSFRQRVQSGCLLHGLRFGFLVLLLFWLLGICLWRHILLASPVTSLTKVDVISVLTFLFFSFRKV